MPPGFVEGQFGLGDDGFTGFRVGPGQMQDIRDVVGAQNGFLRREVPDDFTRFLDDAAVRLQGD